MNPFDLRFLWKGLRGKSLVFSLLFATAVLGYSGSGFLRTAFAAVGLPWWLVWVIPIVLIAMVAKREETWIPGERFRRNLSYSIIGFSVVLGYLLWRVDNSVPEYTYEDDEPHVLRQQTGPRGKH